MESLDDRLSKMEDTLFTDTPMSKETSNGRDCFVEELTPELAQRLLEPGCFDPKYAYKLQTEPDTIVVVKYDPQTEEVIEDYALEADDSVQSYAEMERAVLNHDTATFKAGVTDVDDSDFEDIDDSELRFKPDWRFYTGVVLLLLVVVSIALNVYVSSLVK